MDEDGSPKKVEWWAVKLKVGQNRGSSLVRLRPQP